MVKLAGTDATAGLLLVRRIVAGETFVLLIFTSSRMLFGDRNSALIPVTESGVAGSAVNGTD